jgi:hypothetical protein
MPESNDYFSNGSRLSIHTLPENKPISSGTTKEGERKKTHRTEEYIVVGYRFTTVFVSYLSTAST